MFVFVSARIVKLVFSDHPGARRGDRLVDRLIQVQQDRSQTREKKKNNDNKSNKNKLKNKPKINPYFLPTVPKKRLSAMR